MKENRMREPIRRITAMLLTFSVWYLAIADGVSAEAENSSQEGAQAGMIYMTPEECPRFANPEFISRPLEKAYPGITYNARPAMRGGTYPYRFTLEEFPDGMMIEPVTGTITWVAPAEGTHAVAIKVTDQAGRTATQFFTVNVSKTGFYFVSPDGDDVGPGTIERSWRTVMRVASPPEGFSYQADAIIYLRNGTYSVKVPPQPGRKNANVLRIDNRSPKYWIAYPKETPVIDLGWSESQHWAAQAEQQAAGKGYGQRKEVSAMAYGHRIAFTGDYLYIDGLEVKNACYYMFVMWDGGKTIHLRRMDLHHLWADWAENPSSIFTFASECKGDFNAWGILPRCNAYRNFVIQENRFGDRFYIREGPGGHGGGFVFYTVHDSLIEDNEFRDIYRGECFNDKDNGLGNTYRGNVVRGDCSLLGQWNNDETEICYNYVEGRLRVGLQPGWVRNVWIHHNTIKGNVSLMGGATRRPDPFDESKGNYSNAQTADTARAIRDFPAEKRLVHFYRNVIDAPEEKLGDRMAGVIVAIPNNSGFADRWRYVRWDNNLVDSEAKIELLWNRFTDFSIFKRCGFDKNGVQAPVVLDKEGKLPKNSPYGGIYGR
jgi:hypothetical protein